MTKSNLADVLTYMLAVSLAAGCIAFAAYKVIILRGMENPPADMGLNFPPPKRKIITDDSIEVDSLETQSTTPAFPAQRRDGRILQPYTRDAPIQDYRLLAVIGDVAFVEVLTLRGKDLVPLTTGMRLPGAGPVERIARVDGRWVLHAGGVKLTAER